MTSDNLSALIARLEAATDADEGLDVDIWIAVGRPSEYLVRDLKLAPPDYTASVDSALTLVPEGWQRTINDADNMRDCIVELFHDPTDAEVTVRGKTWPLTICMAALKARTTAPTGEHTTT